MRTLLIAAALTVNAIALPDGIKGEIYMGEYATASTKAKPGEVWKLTGTQVDQEGFNDQGPVTVICHLIRNPKHLQPRFTFTVSQEQWQFLERHTGALYLQRTADGWDYLGKELYRDKNGKPSFR